MMDRNLNAEPREDEKIEKRDLERTKSAKNGTYEMLESSLTSIPPGVERQPFSTKHSMYIVNPSLVSLKFSNNFPV